MDALFNQFESFWALMALLIGFGFLIFVHELGHYMVAKWVGIKVTQFAIGFGPSVVSWRQGIGFRRGSTEKEYEQRLADGHKPESMGETEYRLNWMPLGGYVKMLGQEDLNPDASLTQDERSFVAKPIWARACVLSAGVVMNLIFGVIFFIIAFMVGVDFPPAVVGDVLPGSPAAQVQAVGHANDEFYRGLKPGDQITHINDEPVTDFADVAVNTALASPGETLELTVSRDGEVSPLHFPITPKEDQTTQLLALGVRRPISLEVETPDPGQSLPILLQDAGVKPGMRVISVDGEPIRHYEQFNQAVAQGRGVSVPVTFVGSQESEQIDVQIAALPVLPAILRMPSDPGHKKPAIDRSLRVVQPAEGYALPTVLANAGIRPKMHVVKVNGSALTASESMSQYEIFTKALSDSSKNRQPVDMEFFDLETAKTATVELFEIPALSEMIPVVPNVIGFVPAIRISRVVNGSPAAESGLQKGDLLARAGPINWPTEKELKSVIRQSTTQPFQMAVFRNGKIKELSPITPSYRDGTIGIAYWQALNEPIIAQVIPGSPASQLHLTAGSRILSINGQSVTNYADIQRVLSEVVRRSSSLEYVAGESELPTTLHLRIGYQVNMANAPPSEAEIVMDATWARQVRDIQWQQPLGPFAFKMLLISLQASNPIAAAKLGVKKAHQVMLQTYVTLLRLFQGTVKPSHLRGPLGIADDGTSFAKKGWAYLMFFLGLISINLVVINFLPIPIVDGGLMVFLLIEKLKGSPVSVRVQTAATVVGLAMIGSVFLLTLFYDAKRLLGM